VDKRTAKYYNVSVERAKREMKETVHPSGKKRT
jgi:hypothetical protein